MSSLEKILSENKANLDSEFLSEGHEARFEKLLDQRLHNNKFVIRLATAIAASVIIFVASSVYILKLKNNAPVSSYSASQSVEFIETEEYYSQQTTEALSNLKKILDSQPENTTASVLKELSQMDETNTQLHSELKNNPNDSRLMNAIVQYYQLKLDMINSLTNRFILYSTNKVEHHEDKQI